MRESAILLTLLILFATLIWTPQRISITYDEESVTNIINDNENSYLKIKATKIAYEEVLNNMISKLEPYVVYKEEFSDEDLKELYNKSKNITNNVSKRNLQENENKIKLLILKKI